MNKTTSNKVIHVIQAALFILVVILSTTLYLQERQLSKLKGRFDVTSPAENSQTGEIADESLLGKTLSRDDEAKYKNKIKVLETRINDMQAWQDYLKDTLDEYDERADSAVSFWRQAGTVSQADYSLYFIKDFAQENNFTPELKEKLLVLFNEMNNALKDSVPDLLDNTTVIIKENMAEQMQEYKKIKAEYDEKIAKLLSSEELALLKEYELKGKERELINGLKTWLGDDKLEKEKEEKLIAIMYNYRQSAQEEQRKKAQSYKINEEGPDEETMARMQKDNLEYNTKLYENYASLAEGILSESQMQALNGIVNLRKSVFVMESQGMPGSEEEGDEE